MFEDEDTDLITAASSKFEGGKMVSLDFALRYAETVNASPAAQSTVSPKEILDTARAFYNYLSNAQ